jgi:hypothetical protein
MSIFISYRFDCEMSNTAAPDDGHRKFWLLFRIKS